ncbi:MAG: hypothetical protein ABIS21_08705 [Acidimicrobiales bacterium]
MLREAGSGTRGTTEELLGELELSPALLTAASQLDTGSLEECRHGRLPLRREWHLMGRAGEDLVPTARLMLEHLETQGDWTPLGGHERMAMARSRPDS